MGNDHEAGGRRLAVYAIVDGKGLDGKARWTRIGRAFENHDGSINLLLNALPLGTDKCQIREEREEDRPAPTAAPTVPAATGRRGAPRAEAKGEEVRP